VFNKLSDSVFSLRVDRQKFLIIKPKMANPTVAFHPQTGQVVKGNTYSAIKAFTPPKAMISH
jgi:hypothetical protein